MLFKLGYITGLNGSSNSGLAKHLLEEYKAKVIAIDEQFQALSFSEQVALITNSFCGCSHLIANSFGAYLFLHSMLQKDYQDVKILLLSPILGPSLTKGGGRIPNGYSILKKELINKAFTIPKYISIVYGDSDSHFSNSGLELIQSLNLPLNITKIPNEGHRINQQIIRFQISNFLKQVE